MAISNQTNAIELYKKENLLLKMKLRGQFQGFYQNIEKEVEKNGKKEVEKEDKSGILIRRARLIFEGNAFYPWLKYHSHITLKDRSTSLRDLFIDVERYKAFKIKPGQYKVGFTREYLTSSAFLNLVDRSLNHNYFFLGRDIGLSFHGEISPIKSQYALGVFSGAGMVASAKEMDKFPMISGRFEISPFGTWKYKQTTFEKDKFKIALGFAGAYSKFLLLELEKRAEQSELMKIALKEWEKKQDVKEIELLQFTSDLALFYGPPERRLHFEGDFNWGKIHPFTKAYGFRMQGAFLINKLEMISRFVLIEELKPMKKNIYEITGGLSYYFSEHKLKLQADYSYIKKEKGTEENLVRLQLQTYIF